MKKTIALKLNNYLTVPHNLREVPGLDSPVSEVAVELASLYHHYYLDSFGCRPPDPDPSKFEPTRFLLPCPEFRFQGSGLGSSTAVRRNRSTELGQAFFRWFLHEHLNVTYFAHMEQVLDRQLHRAFNSCRIERVATGDAPDYFCAESTSRVFLGEAKGRYRAVSFENKEFAQWRKQFDRVRFTDASGEARRIKGHIVATRFATEDKPTVQPCLYAEDPETPGTSPIDADAAAELGTVIRSAHYGQISTKLNQPILAAALTTGVPIPSELRISAVIWEVQLGPLEGRRFVGGYFTPQGAGVHCEAGQDGRLIIRADPLRLDSTPGTFFGVEEGVFRELVAAARLDEPVLGDIGTFRQIEPFYSGFSVLRDGSALGPVDFFAAVRREVF